MDETENNFVTLLSDMHCQYIREYVRQCESREGAIIDQFFLSQIRARTPTKTVIA